MKTCTHRYTGSLVSPDRLQCDRPVRDDGVLCNFHRQVYARLERKQRQLEQEAHGWDYSFERDPA